LGDRKGRCAAVMPKFFFGGTGAAWSDPRKEGWFDKN